VLLATAVVCIALIGPYNYEPRLIRSTAE